MAKISAKDAQQQAVRAAASLMAAAARTAPKTRGLDSTEMLILDGDAVESIRPFARSLSVRLPPLRYSIAR